MLINRAYHSEKTSGKVVSSASVDERVTISRVRGWTGRTAGAADATIPIQEAPPNVPGPSFRHGAGVDIADSASAASFMLHSSLHVAQQRTDDDLHSRNHADGRRSHDNMTAAAPLCCRSSANVHAPAGPSSLVSRSRRETRRGHDIRAAD